MGMMKMMVVILEVGKDCEHSEAAGAQATNDWIEASLLPRLEGPGLTSSSYF